MLRNRPPLIKPIALAVGACLCTGFAGCASTDSRPSYGSETPWVYDGSSADGAAYAAEAFTFSKPSQRRRPSTARAFYFKNCSLDDGKVFYSKTSYQCDGPW